MTAEEARKLNDEYAFTQQLDYKNIDKRIEKVALEGKTNISIDLMKGTDHSYRDRLFSYLEEEYVKKGFVVKRNKYGGEDPYDMATISW